MDSTVICSMCDEDDDWYPKITKNGNITECIECEIQENYVKNEKCKKRTKSTENCVTVDPTEDSCLVCKAGFYP